MLRRLNVRVLFSIGISGLLVVVGIVRVMSYSRATPLADWVRSSPLHFLAYEPSSLANVRFFKILATPSVVALIYFYFRWRNAGVPAYPGASVFARSWRSRTSSQWLIPVSGRKNASRRSGLVHQGAAPGVRHVRARDARRLQHEVADLQRGSGRRARREGDGRGRGQRGHVEGEGRGRPARQPEKPGGRIAEVDRCNERVA